MINTESCLFQIHGDMAHRLVAGLWGPLCATLLSIRLGVKERDERVDSKRRFIPVRIFATLAQSSDLQLKIHKAE